MNDRDLLQRTMEVAETDRLTNAELVALLAEVDARRLYLGEGAASLYTYCTQVLRLTEHTAYLRIEAARLSRRFPVLLQLLAEGQLTLSTIDVLGPHLTPENCDALLAAAKNSTKREVERLVAALHPRPYIAAAVRRIIEQPGRIPDPASKEAAASTNEGTTNGPLPPPFIQPVGGDCYVIKVAVTAATHEKLRYAQDLLRHVIPDGDPAEILDRGLTLLVQQLERTRFGRASRPKPASSGPKTSTNRRVSNAVRRAVWRRDGGRCAFVGRSGRCTETGFLELHHVVPYAAGGQSTVDNLALRCRAHNQYEAVEYFGAQVLEHAAKRTG